MNVFEIIVVVNGCIDVLVKIVKEEGCMVKVIEKCMFLYEVRMEGVKIVKGDVVLFVDGDIIFLVFEFECFV